VTERLRWWLSTEWVGRVGEDSNLKPIIYRTLRLDTALGGLALMGKSQPESCRAGRKTILPNPSPESRLRLTSVERRTDSPSLQSTAQSGIQIA
jgi:hypothetical protein